MKESHEQPSKDLRDEWERNLKAAGLPTNNEIMEREEIQINDRDAAKEALEAGYIDKQQASISEILNDVVSDVGLLGKFSKLSENMQDTLIADIEALRDGGATDWEVVEKLGLMIDRDSRILSQKMAEFENLTPEDSDKRYKPKATSDEKRWADESKKDDREIEKNVKKNIDRLINKLKEIKEKSKDNEGKETDGDDSETPKWVN